MSSRFIFGVAMTWGMLTSCSLTVLRPVQEMSDTEAAIRAAKEVKADVLAPELFRQASEWQFKAKREYRLKYFREAKEYAMKARRFAEQAEFEVLQSGGNRVNINEVKAPELPPQSPDDRLPETAPTGDPSQFKPDNSQSRAPEEGTWVETMDPPSNAAPPNGGTPPSASENPTNPTPETPRVKITEPQPIPEGDNT